MVGAHETYHERESRSARLIHRIGIYNKHDKFPLLPGTGFLAIILASATLHFQPISNYVRTKRIENFRPSVRTCMYLGFRAEFHGAAMPNLPDSDINTGSC